VSSSALDTTLSPNTDKLSRYDPTIEDSYSITRKIDGRTWYLHICDTAGQEEYRTLFSRSTLQADAFLLVYDITSRPTLDSLSHFTTMISMEAEERKYRTNIGGKSPVPPVKMIAGNKCDLTDLREVAKQDAARWAKERRCGFLETSARDVVNVEEIFASTCEKAMQQLWHHQLTLSSAIVRRVAEARRLHGTTGNKPTQHPSASSTSLYRSSSTRTTTKPSNHIASSTVLPLNASSLAYLSHDPVPYVQNPTRALTPINASEISEKRTLAGGGALPQHRNTYATTNSSKRRNVSRRRRNKSRHTDEGNSPRFSEKSRWYDDDSDDDRARGLWGASKRRKQHARQRSVGTTNTTTTGSRGRSTGSPLTMSSGYSGYSNGSGSGSDGRNRKKKRGEEKVGFLARLFGGLSCF